MKRLLSGFRSATRSPLLQTVKAAVATVLAWVIADVLVPGELPVFAAIAALLVVQPSVNQSFTRAIERSIGVVIGVGIALGLSLVLGSQGWVILLAIVVAMLVAWAFRATPPTANQVAISAMLVLALGSSSPEYAIARIVETLIGVAIALLVNALIVPPVLVEPARRDVGLLGREIAASLDRLAEALPQQRTQAELWDILIQARLLRPMKEAAETSLAAAEEALRLNPRSIRHREPVEDLRALATRFDPIVTQVIGMTRAYFDQYEDTLPDEPAVHAIAEQLRRAGHDVRLAVQNAEATPEPDTLTSAIPALTAPLHVAPPRRHWVLIGSLMEDLRRIRNTLVEDAS